MVKKKKTRVGVAENGSLWNCSNKVNEIKNSQCQQKQKKNIPAGVIGILTDIKSFRSHYGPGVDSTSNRN